MRHPFAALAGLPALAALLLATVVPAAAQNSKAPAKPYSPHRMPDGHPDLQGTYDLATMTPMERPSGAKAVLTAYVDDYAEVWVNGQMPRRAGITSPATIQGFNIPNRVVLGDSVKAGDKFQVAIFGINGPISVAPPNFLFFRQASLEFYK